jgi:hypothetical protein
VKNIIVLASKLFPFDLQLLRDILGDIFGTGIRFIFDSATSLLPNVRKLVFRK